MTMGVNVIGTPRSNKNDLLEHGGLANYALEMLEY